MIKKIVCIADWGLALLDSGIMEWFGNMTPLRAAHPCNLSYIEATDIARYHGYFVYKQGKQWFSTNGNPENVKYPNRKRPGEVFHRYPDILYSGTLIDHNWNLFEHQPDDGYKNQVKYYYFKRPPFNAKAFIQHDQHTCYVLDYDGQLWTLPYAVYAETNKWARCVECIPKLKQLDICNTSPCGVTLDGLLWSASPKLTIPEYLQWKG